MLLNNLSILFYFPLSSSPSHFHRETILPDEDPEKIVALVDTIKESLNLLASILDYDQTESFVSENECKKEPSKSSDEKKTSYPWLQGYYEGKQKSQEGDIFLKTAAAREGEENPQNGIHVWISKNKFLLLHLHKKIDMII